MTFHRRLPERQHLKKGRIGLMTAAVAILVAIRSRPTVARTKKRTTASTSKSSIPRPRRRQTGKSSNSPATCARLKANGRATSCDMSDYISGPRPPSTGATNAVSALFDPPTSGSTRSFTATGNSNAQPATTPPTIRGFLLVTVEFDTRWEHLALFLEALLILNFFRRFFRQKRPMRSSSARPVRTKLPGHTCSSDTWRSTRPKRAKAGPTCTSAARYSFEPTSLSPHYL